MARHLEQSITAGSATLAGTLTLPDAAAGRVPAVLLLASLLPRDRDGRFDTVQHPGWFDSANQAGPGILARLAAALADHGVASLRYDKRGCGQSDGSWEESGLFTLIDDARDALAVLRGHDEVDASRIGLVGHGEGATLALSVSAADPAVGPLTVIGAPARGWRDVLRRGVAERARRHRGPGQARPSVHPCLGSWPRGAHRTCGPRRGPDARPVAGW